jgi:hypothetical protein
MARRYIDPRAAHAALDRLLELYQGSPQERDSLLKDAEKAFLDLLAPALPSHEPPELDIHSHAGRYDAVQLRGEIVLWWAKVEGIKTNKAVERAMDVTGVGRSTVFDWLDAVDEKHRKNVERMADARSKGSPAEWVELADAYSRLFTESYLCMIHAVYRRKSGKKSV